MFSDIMLKAMTEEAVVALKGGVAKLDVFSTNWSPMEGQIGDGVCCPIYSLSAATDFDAEQNNFGGGETPDGVYIPLSKFLTKAVTLSDKEIQGSGITYGRKTAQAIANSLAAGANAYVFGQLSASGITLSASVNLSSKQNIAQLYATAENNGLDVGSTVVVLTPTEYSKILAELSYDVLGSDRAVAAGKVDHAFGFKSIICASLPSALSAKGYLI